jgi:geranylgeranyl diphosphate synthase type II
MTTKEKEAPLSLTMQAFQKHIHAKIQTKAASFPATGILKDACEYALLSGGKRFRPALVYMVAHALKNDKDVTSAALAIEYFHTASLIADDLPCMDNDDERRNKPTVHKVYGEAIALLVSYALIAEGYGSIAEAGRHFHEQANHEQANIEQDWAMRVMLALENSAFNTGLKGATGGQFLDIFPSDLSELTLREVIHKKTISLFEISFVFGWLFGGGDIDKLPEVKACASHFGMAFQVADDLDDVEQDQKNGRKINVAAAFGVDAAKRIFFEEIKSYLALLNVLRINSSDLLGLAASLESQVG